MVRIFMSDLSYNWYLESEISFLLILLLLYLRIDRSLNWIQRSQECVHCMASCKVRDL
jgi:hypothetical protein